MASTYVGFETFPRDFLSGRHNFATDVFHIMLTNTLPDVVNNVLSSDITEIAVGGGYAIGGLPVSVTLSFSGGATTFVFGSPVVWTATSGGFGPFQYAVLYNYSGASQRLIAYWAYPTSISLLDTEHLTVVPNVVDGIFKVAKV